MDRWDRRLYATCKDILEAKQLDPTLHDTLSETLNRSELKERYLKDREMRDALSSLEKCLNYLGDESRIN